MNPTDKKITGTSTNTSYPTHKTISLVEEKPVVNRQIPPVPIKEVKTEVVAEKKPETLNPTKNTYPDHKTFSLTTAKPLITDSKEEVPETDNKTDNPASIGSKNPVPVKETKTETVSEKKQDTVASKTTYPAHKTFSLTKEAAVITEIKKEITETAAKTNTPGSFLSTIKDNAVEKAGNFIKDQPVVQKLDSIIPSVKNPLTTDESLKDAALEKAGDLIKEQPVVRKLDSLIPSVKNPLATDESLKDAALEKAGNFIKEQPVVQKLDSLIPSVKNPLTPDEGLKDTALEKAGNFIKEQPVVQKLDSAIASANLFATVTNQQNQTYPAHKTVNLEPVKQETIVPPVVKEEQKTVIKNEEPALVAENKPASVVTTPVSVTSENYPAHKTHFFVKEELNPSVEHVEQNIVKPASTLVTPDSNERVSPKTKAPDIRTTPATVATSSKKPIVWIAASAVLLLSSAATAWYAYQQKNAMQEEIVALKQNNEILAESVKKLQKDLYVDDIIARAGKLDAKNNITVIENADASEVLRTCFSVIPNAQSKKGKKTVYIRFIDAAGTVLLKGKENVFEYKGEKIPFSAMQEIDYKGAEMMLCVDFKPSDKLKKGLYKAELYNDGVMDGTVSFELK